MKEFVLPEKWYIQLTEENNITISRYFTKVNNCYRDCFKHWRYIHSLNSNNEPPINGAESSFASDVIKGGFTEITFEQFKKYVLGNNAKVDFTEQELLEEAKKRYPIGCKVKLIGSNLGGSFKNEVRLTQYSYYKNSNCLYVNDNLLLYKNGQWAEIISYPETKVESKEVIPEYVKCVSGFSDYVIPGLIYKVEDKRNFGGLKLVCNIESGYPAGIGLYVDIGSFTFKPSTKEAFDAQNQPRITLGNLRAFCSKLASEGFRSEIKKALDFFKSNSVSDLKKEDYPRFKELLDSINQPKQPLKQAVHCTSQEEWNFVLTKENKYGLQNNTFNVHKGETCLAIGGSYQDFNYFQKSGYQILSFQEWCDLNGYKMGKEVKLPFNIGDYVVVTHRSAKEIGEKTDGNNANLKAGYVGKITDFFDGQMYEDGVRWVRIDGKSNGIIELILRHATPEEINKHSISIGQIPAGESLNWGIEPDKNGAFKYTASSVNIANGECSSTIKRATTVVQPIIEKVQFNYLPEPN